MLQRFKILFTFIGIACTIQAQVLRNGADQIEKLIPLLKDKRIALVVNHTSIVGETQTHLLDTLLALRINVKKIFAPEHGFRGNANAGETVKNGRDIKSGLPILSLYGKNKKPTKNQLLDIDAVIFDIQDVGASAKLYKRNVRIKVSRRDIFRPRTVRILHKGNIFLGYVHFICAVHKGRIRRNLATRQNSNLTAV